ncbi:GntR family transcriptional regulator [Streptomyces sp. SL13]|jgi:DNA-binding GntR family transcriptional regulator|uniref:GntR family transcriptional regulator n=1 Tax=Streptantibioticus silvisoli TaxID=2705255 RepID=A0AA90K9L1_9ACTN|nr:GntR family transcriptional regulator [Streptantibioticus silvisoli]MDI5962075.1 GntR family transcriptional regulator [Streptantibioticus silvisoli]MDI5971293.1 GntR family transcriptional regulator [Streptantibioticus silvisoli]
MSGVTPVRRSSLRQQIADALRDEVLTGRLAAGRHFTVKQIAELYGVSATPVREALVDLAAQGLLDVEHHRGFQVRAFSDEDYRGIVEARTLVTDGLLRRMADLGPVFAPERLASVHRRAEAAAAAARAGTIDVLIGCDLRFWRELALLAGNAHLTDFLDRLRVQSWVYAVPHLRRVPTLAGVFWTGHVPLAQAVGDGDAGTARRIVAEYNGHTLDAMRELAAGR